MEQNSNNIFTIKKLAYLWMVMLGLILVTAVIVGVQVYWWQRAVARAEQQQLRLTIDKLQNEILRLKQQPQLQSVPSNPRDQDYQKLLAGREQKVILALMRKDMNTLAQYVHPKKGVRLSPYAYVNPASDVVFSAGRIRSFFQDRTERIWGYYEDTGTAIKLTNEAYFQSYIYDSNYAFADKISYNREIKDSLTAGNVFLVYPEAIVVEYRCFEGGNSDEATGWRDIKLVFTAEDKVWYLVGIVHDQWTI